MLGLIARRAVMGLAALFVFVTAVFFLVNLLIPFDYAYTFTYELGGPGGAALADQLRDELGLDRPVYLLYLEFLRELAGGGLGTSFGGAQVSEIIANALPTTLLIFGVGGMFAFLLGTWLGRLVAWYRSRVAAGVTTGLSILLYTAFPPLLIFVLVFLGRDLLSGLRRWLGLPTDSMRLWQQYPGLTQADLLRVVGVGLFVALVVAIGVRAWARRNGWRMLSILTLPLAVLGVGLGVWVMGVWELAVEAVPDPALGELVLRKLENLKGTADKRR